MTMASLNPHRNASAGLREKPDFTAGAAAPEETGEHTATTARKLARPDLAVLGEDRGCDPYNHTGRFKHVFR
jgi:hypothetical protein